MMIRKSLLFIVFVFVFVLITSIDASAQKQKYFASGEKCVQALKAGTAEFYTPTYFNLHKPVAAGEQILGLEGDACVRMLTVRGYQWVAQPEGTQMVFRGKQIVRREDCGNPITAIMYPDIPTVTVDTKPTCVNYPGMTIEQAQQLGWKVENGVCTQPQQPTQEMCVNYPGMTTQQARELGWTVDANKVCTQPQQPTTPMCANLEGVPQAIAIQNGYTVDGAGNCLTNTKRKDYSKLYGALCGGGGGAIIGAITGGRGRRVLGAIIGGGAGAGAGAIVTGVTKNTWAGCSGGLAGFLGYVVKKKNKVETGNCPYGVISTNPYGQKVCAQKTENQTTTTPTNFPTSSFPVGTVGYCSRDRKRLCRVNSDGSVTDIGPANSTGTNQSPTTPVFGSQNFTGNNTQNSATTVTQTQQQQTQTCKKYEYVQNGNAWERTCTQY